MHPDTETAPSLQPGALAVFEERQRRAIAEDLHDHLGQALALLRMKIVETQGNAVFCGLDDSLDEMKKLLDQIIGYTRNLTFEISSPVLSELGFGAALEWLGERYSSKDGPVIEVTSVGDAGNAPWEVASVAFRCASELITNAVRHSGASRIVLKADFSNGMIRLGVFDDGCGFDPVSRLRELEKESKFGLLSIIERARSLGGDLKIDSRPDVGTDVTLWIPLPGRGV
jgi:signal transduction histidine kinase